MITIYIYSVFGKFVLRESARTSSYTWVLLLPSLATISLLMSRSCYCVLISAVVLLSLFERLLFAATASHVMIGCIAKMGLVDEVMSGVHGNAIFHLLVVY